MLSLRMRCTAIAEHEGKKSIHIATLWDVSSGSDLGEAEFTLYRDTLKILVAPNALIVGRSYTLQIEEILHVEGDRGS
jgi:hypothetical protein